MSVRACTLEEDTSTQDHKSVQAEAPQYSIALNECPFLLEYVVNRCR